MLLPEVFRRLKCLWSRIFQRQVKRIGYRSCIFIFLPLLKSWSTMPNWWCGPKLRIPKWMAPTIEGARTSFRRRMGTVNSQDSTFRRRLRTLSDNDYGSRFRDSIRRGRRTMSLRSLNRSRSDWTLRRTQSFRDSMHFRRRDGNSTRRRDTTLRRKRTTADIRIIRRSFW